MQSKKESISSAAVITIGDELLNGSTLDTNATFLASNLDSMGIQTSEIVSISDSASHLKETLDRCISRASLIIITGGLGPTKDDLTKEALAEYFGCSMVFSEVIHQRLEHIFTRRGRAIPEASRQIAMIPDGCELLFNDAGTAAGMWFVIKGKVVVSLPGVPVEVRTIWKNRLQPRLHAEFHTPFILHRNILLAGVGESVAAGLVDDVTNALPGFITLASLPSAGKTKLRLTARGNDPKMLEESLDKWSGQFSSRLDKYVYGYDNDRLEAVIGKLLLHEKATLGTAESCTGGSVAGRITTVPGSSAWFEGAVVSYSNSVKKSMLDVQPQTLEDYGAVSPEVVSEMLLGVHKKLDVDYAIAVSGIAGPTGGSDEKPVGLVYIGVQRFAKISEKGPFIRKYVFPGDRALVTSLSVTFSLHLLLRLLRNQLANA